MARANDGWVGTSKKDQLEAYWTANVLQQRIYVPKVQSLPPLNIHYEVPRGSKEKQWTDQALISTESVDNYLAESGAYQRASFANIIEKWKQYERRKTDRLISSFDAHYNMNIRFRHDSRINHSSEMTYAPVAKYYRLLGNENNPKNGLPCLRHRRRLREFQERHTRDLLQLPQVTKKRSQPVFLPKPAGTISQTSEPILETTEAVSGEADINNLTTARPSISVAEQSHHSFA